MSWGRLPTCHVPAQFRQVGNLPHDIIINLSINSRRVYAVMAG